MQNLNTGVSALMKKLTLFELAGGSGFLDERRKRNKKLFFAFEGFKLCLGRALSEVSDRK